MSWYNEEYNEIITEAEFQDACCNCSGFCSEGSISVSCDGDVTNCPYFKKVDTSKYDKEMRSKIIDEVLKVLKETYHNFSGYNLANMKKYGNENANQQAESYSTLMMYEIAYEMDDLIDRVEQMKGNVE